MIVSEVNDIENAVEKISVIAKEQGLDFYSTYFEIVPSDILYTFGAYSGMPSRFNHWSFGKAFQRMKLQYDLNLSRIYELVINTNPSYAFLLEGNSLIQNKLVIAHVFAHVDFFKNNSYFKKTSKNMIENMSVSAKRIQEMEFKYGIDEVEKFIDAAMSLQFNVDSRSDLGKRKGKVNKPTSDYDDLFELDKPEESKTDEEEKEIIEDSDVIRFIIKHSQYLKDWQKEILSIIREERLYFQPQIETKIMNEGWASFWHSRIMRMLDLTPNEALEFAVMHSSVIQPSKLSLNPYFLGYKIWEEIEQKYGQEFMFEVREIENDMSFIRNYLSNNLIKELDLFVFEKMGRVWQITDKDYDDVRNTLIRNLMNGGLPYINAVEKDFNHNGELLLKHYYDDVNLDYLYLKKTLEHVYRLWGRNVHLETVVDNKKVLFSFDGEELFKQGR